MTLIRNNKRATLAQLGRRRVAETLKVVESRAASRAQMTAQLGKMPPWQADDPMLLPFYALGPELVPCPRGEVPRLP